MVLFRLHHTCNNNGGCFSDFYDDIDFDDKTPNSSSMKRFTALAKEKVYCSYICLLLKLMLHKITTIYCMITLYI